MTAVEITVNLDFRCSYNWKVQHAAHKVNMLCNTLRNTIVLERSNNGFRNLGVLKTVEFSTNKHRFGRFAGHPASHEIFGENSLAVTRLDVMTSDPRLNV